MSQLAWLYNDEASAVDNAARKAMDLIRKFGEMDPHDVDDTTASRSSSENKGNNKINNPWHHPEAIFAELDAARNELTAAWDKLRERVDKDESSLSSSRHQRVPYDEDDFRAAYMSMVTDAFSDLLEDMRKGEDQVNFDVDVLVDCLQSGMDLMTQDEKELFVNEKQWGGDGMLQEEETEESKLTPHEIRRRQLGFHIETAVCESVSGRDFVGLPIK
jgi:hypothetical protein